MVSSLPKNNSVFGRFDPIHIGLAVISVIFIILSIVFIILFATKHDTSSSFLSTGFTLNSKADLENDFKSRLQKKFTLNSFGLDVQYNQVNAVFSLRGSVSVDQVQSALSSSQMVTQLNTTYGDNAYSVCHQTQTISTLQPTSTTPTTTTTAKPVSQYCNGSPQRDILLIIDMNDLTKTNKTEKVQSLEVIKNEIASNVNFGSTNIFVAAVAGENVVDVSTTFTTTKDQFVSDFNNVYKVVNTTTRPSLDFGTLKTYAINKFPARSATPDEVILLTDKPVSAQYVAISNTGIYFTIAGVNKNYVSQYSNYIDESLSYDSWTDLATQDPFSQLVCSFFKKPTTTTASQRFFLDFINADDVTNSPKCEVLDMILLFDTSESLSRILVDNYKNFATKFVKQYKYSDDLTRVGIMQFNSETKEVLTLAQGTNVDTVLATIKTVEYTAGLTDITKALNAAYNIFQTESHASSGKVLVVLSDAIPTVDSYDNEIIAGKKLADIGVQTLIVGYTTFSDDVLQRLDQITKPEYIYQSLDDTTLNGVTGNILTNYPCPPPQCVTAYFAVEVSEATNDVVVDNLRAVSQLVDKNAGLQTGTELYQLITYSEGLTKFNPSSAVSAKDFKTYLQTLIDDSTKLDALRGGNTRLDTSIDDITNALKTIGTKNPRFSADILFFGEANDAVLDPDVDTTTKRNQLKASALNLQSQTGGRIYVVDVSRPVALYGSVLWDSVTTSEQIVNSSVYLENTNYFKDWTKLSCQLPAFQTCYDTQIDIAIILDLQKQDYNFISYIKNFVQKFSGEDDAHISMFAYGAQKTMMLTNLTAHTSTDLQNSIVTYEEWRNSSLFMTTTPQPTTASLTTQKPSLFEELYTVGTSTVTQLFDSIRTQFGCSHYSDDTDRLFAPNVFIFASDNFDSYLPDVWTQFHTEITNRFGCWDCAGTPTFLFLSRNDGAAPTPLGATVHIADSDLDIDRNDDTSTQANINKFNSIVSSVCNQQMRYCSTYFCTST